MFSGQISVGGVRIGGGAPVSVQSMTTTDTRDPEATLAQIGRLCEAGCDIVRVAVPDGQAAAALKRICDDSPLPVVADIHFDHRLAVAAAEAGVSKIRVNPGNIGSADKLREITSACRSAGIPIRIGVNAGSLPKGAAAGGTVADAMLESALRQMDMLDALDFGDVCVSLKSSDVMTTIEAYLKMRRRCDVPLHLGVTETGTLMNGVIRSSVGIGALLAQGVGDTIRVSLTADPVEEVRAGKAILRACGLLKEGVTVISCPTCGRCHYDVIRVAGEVERALAGEKRPLTVAVMGCEVNGPGEASHADAGIAGGKDCVLLFKKGKIVDRVPPDQAFDALMKLIESL